MKIIQLHPDKNGGRSPIQSWSGRTPPKGYGILASDVFSAMFQEYNGFVLITLYGDTVTGMEPNIEAWEAWKASLPPEPEPEGDPIEFLKGLMEVMKND